MAIFMEDKEDDGCSNCLYATLYIPSFSFPFSDPYCSKGNGKCEVDKVCGDFVRVDSICGWCEYFEVVNRDSIRCNKHNIDVHYVGRVCDDYEKKKVTGYQED